LAVTDVAVAGVGRMGAAMAGRLIRAGNRVTVFNRHPDRAAFVAARLGAEVAATAREAASRADIVFLSLADDAAVRQVATDLAVGLRPGAVVLDMSTVHPDTSRAVETLVAAAGASMLDAPVSGSVPVVERGELTVLVGGDETALGRARPALEAFASRIFHLGPVGSGSTMKLAVNAILYALNQALAESLVLSERAGIDRAQAYEVFQASAIAAPFVHYKRDSFLRPEDAPVAFAIDLVAKDLELIDALAGAVGARMAQLAVNRQTALDAQADGYGHRDLSTIAELLRR